MQEVIEGSTDAIHLDVPAELVTAGGVSSVEVRVATPSTSLPDTYDSATAEGVSWTLAAASLGATSLTTSATTGVPTPGRSYLVRTSGAEDAAPLVVEVEEVNASDDGVTLREPLPRAITAGELLISHRWTHALTADETEHKGHGLAIWKVTTSAAVNGRTVHYFEVGFRIVERLTLAPYLLNGSALTRYYPAVHRYKPTTDTDLNETIETAWLLYVRPAIEDRHLDVNRIKSWERLNPFLASAAFYHLVSNSERATAEFVEDKLREMERQRDSLFASQQFWIDTADERSLTPEDDPEHGMRGGAARKVR